MAPGEDSPPPKPMAGLAGRCPDPVIVPVVDRAFGQRGGPAVRPIRVFAAVSVIAAPGAAPANTGTGPASPTGPGIAAAVAPKKARVVSVNLIGNS